MKGFKDQFIRCREDEIAYDEKCNYCGHEQIMCGIYGGHCMSGKCREARLKEANGSNFFRVTRIWYVKAEKARDAATVAKNWDHDSILVEKLDNVIPIEMTELD